MADTAFDKALEVIKRLGYTPYALTLLSFLITTYKKAINLPPGDRQSQMLDLAAGGLFATALIWALVRLFQRWFKTRPARGLIEGVAAGIFTGIIGGYFGYSWHDLPPMAGVFDDPDNFDERMPGVRSMLALIFAIPIAGMVGLGCDLVHGDRHMNWRKNVAVVFIVATCFLLAVGLLIFKYLPRVNGRGICFSDLLFLFEFFLLGYSIIVAVNLEWKLPKYLSRLVWIAAVVLITRVVTGVIQTDEFTSVSWARALGIAAQGVDQVSFWERVFPYDEDPGAGSFNEYLAAKLVVGLCLWSIGAYALFYLNHPWAVKLDKVFARWFAPRPARKPRKRRARRPAGD